MKQTQLNSEQSKQLLSLCLQLFPDYRHVRYGKNWDSDEIWFTFKDENYEVHWYEFCMRHLPKAIWYKLNMDVRLSGFGANVMLGLDGLLIENGCETYAYNYKSIIIKYLQSNYTHPVDFYVYFVDFCKQNNYFNENNNN